MAKAPKNTTASNGTANAASESAPSTTGTERKGNGDYKKRGLVFADKYDQHPALEKISKAANADEFEGTRVITVNSLLREGVRYALAHVEEWVPQHIEERKAHREAQKTRSGSVSPTRAFAAIAAMSAADIEATDYFTRNAAGELVLREDALNVATDTAEVPA